MIHRLRELFPDVERTPERGRLPSALIPALDVSSARGDRIMLADLAESCTRGETAHRALNAMDERRENLTRAAVEELYRGMVRLSASRMDQVKSCHYAYFLKYGLKAQARKPAGLDAPEAGTFVHYVLEHVLSEAKRLGGVSAVDADQIRSLARAASEQYIRESIGGLEDKTPRLPATCSAVWPTPPNRWWSRWWRSSRAATSSPLPLNLALAEMRLCRRSSSKVNGVQVSISRFCGPGRRLGAQWAAP